MRALLIPALALAISGSAFAREPDCASPDSWPANIARTRLKVAGALDPAQLDLSKTTVTRISSEKVGKGLFRQVHLVRFLTNDGKVIQAITVNEATDRECSGSEVDVYLIARKLGMRSDALGRPGAQK